MKRIVYLVALLFTLSLRVGQAQPAVPQDKTPYPNELPTLKLYSEAKWNSLRPYVSTIGDVEKLLGESVPILDDRHHGNFGFDYDLDWTIVIDVIGKGGELSDSVAGRVLLINLYPKKRVSLVGADFRAFRGYSYTEGNEEGTVYYDKFGLRYSIYAKDSADGRFHAGDLQSIIYGPSDEETEKYTNKGKADAERRWTGTRAAYPLT